MEQIKKNGITHILSIHEDPRDGGLDVRTKIYTLDLDFYIYILETFGY